MHSTDILTLEEEEALWHRLQAGDAKARDIMIMRHQRLVWKISRKWTRYPVQVQDLYQEGNIGLLKAVDVFDFTKGRFCKFACMHVDERMRNFCYNNMGIVKRLTTHEHRKVFANRHRFDSAAETAEGLGLTEKQVESTLARLTMDRSISNMLEDDGEEFTIPDENQDPERDVIQADLWSKVHALMKTLTDRERYIISDRYLGQERTFAQLSDDLDVSKQRVAQIEEKALKKLAQHFQKEAFTSPARAI